jgi:hypothetical protein
VKPFPALGIAAEILFCGEAAKKIEAESPPFSALARKKERPNTFETTSTYKY